MKQVATAEARESEYHQGNIKYRLLMFFASIKSHKSRTRLQFDFAGRIASVTAIRSDVFGVCVEVIKVSVEIRITGGRLCCGADIGEISERLKAAHRVAAEMEWLPGI